MGEFLRIYKSDLTDRQLSTFWRTVQAAGRARAIGFDGPPMNGQDFCRWMRRDDVHPWLVLFRGEPMGLYYLTNRQGRAAHVHFITLPCGTRRTAGRLPVAVAAGLFGIGSALWEREGGTALVPQACGGHKLRAGALDRAGGASGGESGQREEGGFLLDTLIGVTPTDSREAVRFVRRMGGVPCGEVPDLCWRFDSGRNVAGLLTVFNRDAVPAWTAKL